MVRTMNGRLMCLKLLLLFWLSLVPFTTAWMGESQFAATPTALYGLILLLAALSNWLLQRGILNQHSGDSSFVLAMGKDWKGKLSPLLYLIAVLTAYVSLWISGFFFVLVAVIWSCGISESSAPCEATKKCSSILACRRVSKSFFLQLIN